jgi:hypothetical protein
MLDGAGSFEHAIPADVGLSVPTLLHSLADAQLLDLYAFACIHSPKFQNSQILKDTKFSTYSGWQVQTRSLGVKRPTYCVGNHVVVGSTMHVVVACIVPKLRHNYFAK